MAVPLYLAESLGPDNRGTGTAIFQWFLTFGLVAAALAGLHYAAGAEQACALGPGANPVTLP